MARGRSLPDPGIILSIIGVLLVMLGIGSTLLPAASVKVGLVEIGGLSPFSATCVGVGIIFILIGMASLGRISKRCGTVYR